MPISTITSKGQVTIPKKVRERLRLRAGDRLDFHLEDDGTIRVRPIARKVSEVFGVFKEKARGPYQKAEISDRLRKAFREGRL